VDATGATLVPGLIDAHFHIEGSMITVRELARVLLPRGVTALTCDPHEIGNVLGADGIEMLFAEAAGCSLKVLLRVPAQLPGTPDLETTGGSLDDEQIFALLGRDDAVSLAGDCSPTWLLGADPVHLARVDYALRHGLAVNGQEPDLTPAQLNAFVAAGPQDTHIAASADMLLAEVRLGLKGIINNMPFQFPDAELAKIGELIRTGRLDPRHLLLCADDVHPNLLLRDGAVDAALRRAIRCGVPAPAALQMATINVAAHYHLDATFGSIAPGRVADISLVDTLDRFEPSAVIADGALVARDGRTIASQPDRAYPGRARATIRLDASFVPADFDLPAPEGAAEGTYVQIRALYPGSAKNGRLLPGTAKQEHTVDGRVLGGVVVPLEGRDVAWAAVVDRHSGSRRIGRCFVQGFGLQRGSLASTVNHDNHNLLVVGANVADMATAANRVVELGGGVAIARSGSLLAELALPIAGLMSDEPIEVVAARVDDLERGLVDDLGISPLLNGPLMLLQMFALVNVPALGLSDHGLIDVYQATPVPAVS
jgi:adenine deaminase